MIYLDLFLREMNTSYITVYLYSPDSGVVGMQVRSLSSSSSTWTTYWYEKNLQGDIVAIYGANGTKYVNYSYDAWGNHTPAYSNDGASIVPIASNPLRYRGYYYDADLGLYYLQSRYYDSNTGRFINADIFVSTGIDLLDSNMYAYCCNNPVIYADYNGKDAILITSFKPGHNGVPVVGHSALLVDSGNGWYFIEFGRNYEKDTIEVLVENANSNNLYGSIEERYTEHYWSTYLKGDYSGCYTFAQPKAGSDLDGYDPLLNNCVMFVCDELKYGNSDYSCVDALHKNIDVNIPILLYIATVGAQAVDYISSAIDEHAPWLKEVFVK